MKQNRVDCLGLGIMPLDLLCSVPRFPDIGGKIDATSIDIRGGGPVPNVMAGLAKLGYTSAVISGIGDDFFGKQMKEELQREGVATRWLIRKQGQSEMAVGYVEAETARRTIVLHRRCHLHPSNLKLDSLPIPRLIHLDGRDLAACMKLAKWGRKQGAVISFDIGSMRNDVSPIFPLVDHLIVADSFALPFTKSRTASAAARKLRAYCSGTIVVTSGTNGSIGCEQGIELFMPAFKVKAIDTTGAGDAYHTGYLHALLSGHSLPDRMTIGSAVAAIKVQSVGARGGLPDRSSLQQFLRKRPAVYA